MTQHPVVEHGSDPGTYTYRGWAIVQCAPGPVDVDAPHMVCPIGRSLHERMVLPSLAMAAAYVSDRCSGADAAAGALPVEGPRRRGNPGGSAKRA